MSSTRKERKRHGQHKHSLAPSPYASKKKRSHGNSSKKSKSTRERQGASVEYDMLFASAKKQERDSTDDECIADYIKNADVDLDLLRFVERIILEPSPPTAPDVEVIEECEVPSLAESFVASSCVFLSEEQALATTTVIATLPTHTPATDDAHIIDTPTPENESFEASVAVAEVQLWTDTIDVAAFVARPISPPLPPPGLKRRLKRQPDPDGKPAKDSHGSSDGFSKKEEPIPDTNLGCRLLQRLGWRPGQGLGAAGTGRTEPVAATKRKGRKGLGM